MLKPYYICDYDLNLSHSIYITFLTLWWQASSLVSYFYLWIRLSKSSLVGTLPKPLICGNLLANHKCNLFSLPKSWLKQKYQYLIFRDSNCLYATISKRVSQILMVYVSVGYYFINNLDRSQLTNWGHFSGLHKYTIVLVL